jgi:hypothetical protein
MSQCPALDVAMSSQRSVWKGFKRLTKLDLQKGFERNAFTALSRYRGVLFGRTLNVDKE